MISEKTKLEVYTLLLFFLFILYVILAGKLATP